MNRTTTATIGTTGTTGTTGTMGSTIRNVAPFARADLLLLVGRIFAAPKAGAVAGAAGVEDWPHADELRGLIAAADLSMADRDGVDAALQAAIEAVRLSGPETLRSERDRLFEGSVICPVNESVFVRRDKGAILADIAAFHQAFGLRLSPSAGEKADHIVAELELLALLLVMSGKAAAEGYLVEAETALNAAHAFATDHLSEWLPAFCRHVMVQYGLPLFPLAAAALQAVWSAVATVQGWPAGVGPEVDGAVHGDSGSPYECDMATAESSDASAEPLARP